MDDFLETSSKLYEFQSTTKFERELLQVRNVSCGTEITHRKESHSTQSTVVSEASTQTEDVYATVNIPFVREKELALWLKKIYPIISAELQDGPTPIHDVKSNISTEFSMVPYQHIPTDGRRIETHSTAEATWLSTRLDEIPSLIISSSPFHKGWCEHIHQSISLYVPKRLQRGHFAAFVEVQTIPVKACIQFLSTNPWKKDLFVGITIACDIYLWLHNFSGDTDEIKEISYISTSYSSIVGVDWLSVDELLVAHSDGTISFWKISEKLELYNRFGTVPGSSITKILALPQLNFVVGTEEGNLLYGSILQTKWKHSEIIEINFIKLEKHSFAITNLMQRVLNGCDVIVSYDLSGELFIHDVNNYEEGPLLAVKMPLRFRNPIACSKNLDFIVSLEKNGTLQLYSLKNEKTSCIQGCFIQKGNLLKLSDNGFWLIAGVQNGTYQILSIKQNQF